MFPMMNESTGKVLAIYAKYVCRILNRYSRPDGYIFQFISKKKRRKNWNSSERINRSDKERKREKDVELYGFLCASRI